MTCKHEFEPGVVLVNPWTNGRTINPDEFERGEGLWRLESAAAMCACLKCKHCGHSYIPEVWFDYEGYKEICYGGGEPNGR